MICKILITHPQHGVFLGSAMGLAFWSECESAGQNQAVICSTEDTAREFIATWSEIPEGLELQEVMVDDQAEYATIDQCVAAGLKAWDPCPSGSFSPVKKDMLGVLRTSERMFMQLSNYAQHGAEDAGDWADRLGAMYMALAMATTEVGHAIACSRKGDTDRAAIRVKASTARLQRATALLNDEMWAEWKGGKAPGSSIVTLQRSNGAANDVPMPDDGLH